LSKERILRAAVDLVDRQGLSALTMRGLGAELGVEAMSLYKHVANKDEILDGIVEHILGEIEIPVPNSDWRDAMRRRATSAREVLLRHSWAIGLLESRGMNGPAVMRYTNAVLGTLRAAGFPLDAAAHAYWLLDGFVYGQVIQETNVTAPASSTSPNSTTAEPDEPAMDDYPHLMEMVAHAANATFSFDQEFEYGLNLILDALQVNVTAKD